ncbi:hypothetical protein [Dactylosporangium sp. CA-092794]|uniref:hypothetical protein n=1 Tax=Dactylosporangium sp. CA-092794 TaxID=3239929 RepID=UPI003D948AB0
MALRETRVVSPDRCARRQIARNLIAGTLLKLGPIARKATGVISGIGIDYRAARRATDVALAGDPARLYEALRGGRFVLVAPGMAAHGIIAPWADRVTVVAPADPSTPTCSSVPTHTSPGPATGPKPAS